MDADDVENNETGESEQQDSRPKSSKDPLDENDPWKRTTIQWATTRHRLVSHSPEQSHIQEPGLTMEEVTPGR